MNLNLNLTSLNNEEKNKSRMMYLKLMNLKWSFITPKSL